MLFKTFGVKNEEVNYRIRDGAYLITINDDCLFPVIKNSDGYYLIGGGIEDKEEPVEALIREVKEEIGYHIGSIQPICENLSYYELRNQDWCSRNYFFYSDLLDEFTTSEDENVLIWLTLEEGLHLLTLEHQKWGLQCFARNIYKFINNQKVIDSILFMWGILQNSEDILRQVPKSDLHNHAVFGASPELFCKLTHHQVEILDYQFDNLKEMSLWCDKNVSRAFDSKEGFLKRTEGAFIQAKEDGIKKLCFNFGVCAIKYFESAREMVSNIQKLKDRYFSDGEFMPELCLDRNKYSEQYVEQYKELLACDYFVSLDMVGDEKASYENLIPLYRMAEKKGMILKAHLGEFGNAEDVITGIKKLHLTQVQHGIAIIESREAMDFIRDHQIQLNITVSSNYGLSRVSAIKTHPIKELFEYGIKVTINTDDNLIFNTDINKEYLKLYKDKVLNASELDRIRVIGLTSKK
ncbi:NUDIX domain-containing protein [Holdemania filiformis]|uniref:NUDIX domain-containing protein n=1 Tax=Holdemania filiformis TaxID=61171 RepID=UPI00242F4A01|nr:NUDIX domain-containing protein [Holdemania filiformis]